MPTKFNNSSEGRRVDLDPVIPVQSPIYDDTAAREQAAYAAINPSIGGGKQLSDLFGAKSNENALGAYAVEAGDIVAQTEGYASERERIMQGLSTAQDKETVARYYTELSRLRRGEIQGALDPLSASARINSLTKKYINRNPGLALKFRQIHNGVLDDIPQVSGFSGKEVDPDLEAMNEVVKQATKNNITPNQQLSINREELNSQIAQREFEAKTRLGTASEADIAKVLLAKGNEVYSKIFPMLQQASSNPNFKGVDWELDLAHAKNQVEMAINSALADAQLHGKFTLSGDFQTRISKQVLDPFDQLLAVAPKLNNPATRAQAARDLKTITESNDWMSIRKDLGPLVSIYGADIPELYESFHNVVGQLKQGGRPELEALANAGDFRTKLILEALDNKSLDGVLAQGVANTAKGEDLPDVGDPLINKMNFQASLNVAMSPAAQGEVAGKMFTALAGQYTAFEAFDKRPDASKRLSAYPSAQEALKKQAPKYILEPVSKTAPIAIQGIEYDVMGPDGQPFRASYPQSMERVNMGMGLSLPKPAIDKYGQQRTGPGWTEPDPNIKKVVDRLNQTYRVMRSFMGKPEASKWATTTLDELKAAFNPYADIEGKKNNPGNPTTMKNTTSTKKGADGSTTETNTVEVTQQSSDAAQAAAMGMTVEEFTKWANTPAQ